MNRRLGSVSLIIALVIGQIALAKDIVGVQPAALDQPRINALLSRGPVGSGTLLIADFGGGIQTFNIQAFFDTGASGVLLSNNTADLLGVQRATYNGQDVVFSDVGVAGADDFNVSEPLYIGLAPYAPGVDLDNIYTYQTVYSQTFGPIRTQIGPIGVEPDPVLGDLDVFGVPVMRNKVVVMDPKPVNTFVDTMRTYVYNPGSGQIPTTSLHIRLSKADFSPYTQVTPPGAPGPDLAGNPFIGPDPTRAPQSGDPPPVTVSFQGHSTTGSFLLDTGAAASMISSAVASQLGVSYDPQTVGTDNPILLYNGLPVVDQFTLTIGGIGGTTKVAGFFLDSLLVPTQEGQGNPANNLDFLGAPVLVTDITVKNPSTNGTLTLDGIFGMNFLVASAYLIEAQPLPIIANLTRGPFSTLVYDDQAGMLGVEPAPPQPNIIPKSWFGDGEEDNWNFTSQNWFDPTILWFARYQDGDDVSFPEYSLFPVARTVNIASTVRPGSVTIDNSGTFTYTFTGADIAGTTTLTKLGSATVTFQNSNTYTGLTDIQEGTVVFAASQNIGPVLVRSAGRLVMNASQHLAGLNVVGGRATLTAGGGKVLRLGVLEISGSGRLDLTDNSLISDTSQTSVTYLRSLLWAAYSSGPWTGPGLTSTAAAANPARYGLGYADNAVLGLSVFRGQPVDASSLLVRFTYMGDANLDGQVDITDLGALATNWQTADRFWTDADFNYDGVVDITDLGLFATNWQQGVGNPLGPESLGEALFSLGLPGVSVPEPASMGLIGLCLAGVLARRFRR